MYVCMYVCTYVCTCCYTYTYGFAQLCTALHSTARHGMAWHGMDNVRASKPCNNCICVIIIR